ncbi:MAG: site-2 protease family protein [Candidatus Latescibacteria bacterium]|nr:site-2 protease family protein [Candidatus Latescibacterota bacterium]
MPENTQNPIHESDLFDIRELSRYMEIGKIGPMSIKGKIFTPLDKNIAPLGDYFKNQGYLAFFDITDDRENPHSINLGRSVIQTGIAEKSQSRSTIISIVLFIATVFTTLLIGSLNRGGNPFINIKDFMLGIPFSFSLLLILTGHELGHYFTARKHKVVVTLPYFLPIPHPLIGTMGAFIRIKSVLPNKNALIRIGLMGPLVGFILAIPITIIGIKFSEVVDTTQMTSAFRLGSSILFHVIYKIFHPNLPDGHDIMLHPMAFAGWLGFFVTAINLLPIGQLDGGHIAYAIFGRKRKYVMIGVIVALALMGLLWPGWFFWVLLILAFGLKHPKAQDEITPLTKKDKILGLAALVILILAFIPSPFIIK